MDLTIRDWMVIIGALLIAAVAIDAWRRVRKQRQSRVKVKLVEPGRAGSDRDADLNWLRELPNGGGRNVDRRIAGTGSADTAAVEGDANEQNHPLTGVRAELADDDDAGSLNWLEPSPGPSADNAGGKPLAGQLPRAADSEVFMVNVLCRDRAGFSGEDILQILLACDLRFGDMNFFHRHEFEAGRGAIQFSVANLVQPGVFDIDNMRDFATPGLVFFVTLPGPEDMIKAFDYMVETAQTVARNLNGDVLDDTRSAITRQSLQHNRQQIRDLERRLLARAR